MMSALSRCNGDSVSLQSQKYLLAEKVWEPLFLCMGTFNGGDLWGSLMKKTFLASSPPTRYILFSWFIYFLFSSLDHHITSISLISLYMLFIFYQLHSTIKFHVSRDFCLFCSYILKPWPVPGTQVGTPHIFVEWINMDFMEKKVVQPKCVGGFLFHGLSLNF